MAAELKKIYSAETAELAAKLLEDLLLRQRVVEGVGDCQRSFFGQQPGKPRWPKPHVAGHIKTQCRGAHPERVLAARMNQTRRWQSAGSLNEES